MEQSKLSRGFSTQPLSRKYAGMVSLWPEGQRTITSATVDGLILLKLYALPSLYRQGDFTRVGLYENDVATLMFYHRPVITPLIEELRAYVSGQDFTAIHEIVADLEQRIHRVQRKPPAE